MLDEVAVHDSCARCGSSFKPWGFARPRMVRERHGQRRLVRPRRVRCRGCRVTHVLLPAELVPRRADAAHIILGALLASADGRGHRAIAAELSLSAGTVRGWIRRASANAEIVRGEAMGLAIACDPLLGPSEPAGTVLGDALDAVGVAAAAARRRLGPVGPRIGMAMVIGRLLLHPLRT